MAAKALKKKFQSKKIVPVEEILRRPNQKSAPNWRLAAFGEPEKLNLFPASISSAPKIMGHRCTNAWTVQPSPERLARFHEAERQVGNVKILYHGTTHTSVAPILKSGLQPGRSGCMFGSGIYLGDPDKASGYMGWHSTGKKYMFRVRAALGRIKEEDRSHRHRLENLLEQGFHSVAGIRNKTVGTWGPLRHSEYVVYSPDQVLPEKVFEYVNTVREMTIDGKETCQMVTPDETPRPGLSAFADLYWTECGNQTQTLVDVIMPKGNTQSVAICPKCIQRLKLKKGDRVRVRMAFGRWSKERQTLEVKVEAVHGI